MMILRNPVDDVRIRSGQRKLIFATATKVGLRTEQLYDLVECASADRTRVLPQLTIGEARWMIGVLKTMERAPSRLIPLCTSARPAPEVDAELLRQAVRRGGRDIAGERCSSCHARLRPRKSRAAAARTA